MESKEVAQTIANILNEKKAKDIVIIDIAEKSSFADYFVIATGGSERQLGALADDVEDKFAELEITPKSKDGRPDTGWILVEMLSSISLQKQPEINTLLRKSGVTASRSS